MTTNHKEKRLQYLFHQYISGQISEEEYLELWDILHIETAKKPLLEELQWLWEKVKTHPPVISAEKWDEKIKHLISEEELINVMQGKRNKPVFRLRFTGWAAAIVVVLIAGIFYFRYTQLFSDKMVKTSQQEDLLPGGNKATLLLANGSTISLDSSVSGIISRQGNADISEAGQGNIIYRAASHPVNAVVYNTLSTPRGGQYRIKLPDGTKVWLNSASTLHFPVPFKGQTREVKMTGEAYFEVAADASRPFVVSVDGMKVKVLGTHFNIMAYDGAEDIKTTLLSGSVSILKGNAHKLLVPGDQATINKEGTLSLIKDANTAEAVAWKNGLFWFQDNTIQEVMQQISRWYNVDVVIKGEIPQHFTGSMPRDVPVSKIFEILQETGRIRFKIKDNKIIVSP